MQEASPADNKPFLSFIFQSETVLLFLLPVAAYYVALAYEKGYCDSFGIPLCAVTIDLTTIFAVAVGGLSLWFLFVQLASAFFSPSPIAQYRWVDDYAAILILYAITAVCLGRWAHYALMFATLAGAVALWDCSYAFIILRDDPRHWSTRLQGFQAFFQLRQYPFLASPAGRQFFTFLFAALVFGWVSYCIGGFIALKTVAFDVSADDSTLLFIGEKDAKAICAKYDPASRRIMREFVVLPFSEEKQTHFVERKIGPLVFPDPN